MALAPFSVKRGPAVEASPRIDGRFLSDLALSLLGGVSHPPVHRGIQSLTPPSVGSGGVTETPNGKAFFNNFSSGIQDTSGSVPLVEIAAASSWTAQCVIHNINVFRNGANGGFFRTGSSQNGNTFLVENGTSQRPWVRVNGSNILKPVTGPTWVRTAGQKLNILVRCENANRVEVWWDGQVQHAASHAQTQEAAQGNSGIWAFGAQSITEFTIGGWTAIRWWRRYLPDTEMQLLAANENAFYEKKRIWVPITAAGGGVVGASSSQIDLAAGSSGAVLVAGASSQPLVFGGASSGAVAIAGASSQAVNLTGSATGTTVNAVTGASAATIDLGASAAGTVAVAGASSVQIVMAGTSTGTTTNSVTGASDQTLGFSGSSAGLVSVAGASAGQIDLSAAATGKANVVGQSSVSIDLYAAGSGINGDGSTLSGGILVRPSRRRYVAQDGDRLLVFETRAAAEAAQAKIDEARQVASVEAAKVISKAQARKAKARRADAARQAVQALAVQPVAVESLREIQASVPANTHEAAQIEAARAAADLHAVYAVWQAIQEDEQDAADALEASAKFDQAIIGQLVQTLGALRAALSTH